MSATDSDTRLTLVTKRILRMAFWLSLPSIGTVGVAAPEGATVQLIGRARLSDGVWQVTWPGVG